MQIDPEKEWKKNVWYIVLKFFPKHAETVELNTALDADYTPLCASKKLAGAAAI
jgi:hypothetical protein